jgi:hypothetical protein
MNPLATLSTAAPKHPPNAPESLRIDWKRKSDSQFHLVLFVKKTIHLEMSLVMALTASSRFDWVAIPDRSV